MVKIWTYFGGIGESRFENGSIHKVARVHIVARMAGGRLRVVWISGGNSVLEKIACQLGMLLLLAVMSRCSSHMFFQHGRSHGSFAASQRPRTIYPTNVTTATHTASNSCSLIRLLVFLVLHLINQNQSHYSFKQVTISELDRLTFILDGTIRKRI